MEKELLDIFKCMLVADNAVKSLNFTYATNGIILNFKPSASQEGALNAYIRDNRVKTLFSVQEVNELSTSELIYKQIAHYAVAYFSGFTLDIRMSNDDSETVPVTFIRGVTKAELQELIDDSLYSNRPVKDSNVLAGIIKFYSLDYRINDIKNNELRVLLFDVSKDRFTRGDDAVRYIVNQCSDSELLIKSKDVVNQVHANSAKIGYNFLENHKGPLAEVYNRHKRILMAIKTGSKSPLVKSSINKIARKSKKAHKAIIAPASKTFMSDLKKYAKSYNFNNLETFSLRDKFKLLNLLDFKMLQSTQDVFVIRNGKTYLTQNRPVFNLADLEMATLKIIESIRGDLKHLEGKTICLPEYIDYGLPVSRKQTVGHLPFGTKVHSDELEISSGVYWQNEWGARDIDLSCITIDGMRTGWGTSLGYNRGMTGIQFSGDITNAPESQGGAMEFMTSSTKSYGLFANIFSGEVGCKIEIVVGMRSDGNWISTPLIREEVKLNSNGNLVGFVEGKTFTVFMGRLGNGIVSNSRDVVLFQKGQSMNWTVKKLLDRLKISYTTDRNADYDLSYEGFTIDKLEKLFAL